MPAIVAAAAAPGGAANLFSAAPTPPAINDPLPSPLPVPTKKPKPKPPPPTTTKNHENGNPNPRKPSTALRTAYSRTHYHKPVPPGGAVLGEGERAVVVGASGVSYCLPRAPFEFRFSYSETPRAAPLAIREPVFLPFAPPSMPRSWTGKAPLLSKKEKERRRGKIRLFEHLGGASAEPEAEEGAVVLETRGRRALELGNYAAGDGRSREEVLGSPLTRVEVRALLRFPNLDRDESDLDDDSDSSSSSSSAAAALRKKDSSTGRAVVTTSVVDGDGSGRFSAGRAAVTVAVAAGRGEPLRWNGRGRTKGGGRRREGWWDNLRE